jgi:V/A-type H+-transporting ATPase subunit F
MSRVGIIGNSEFNLGFRLAGVTDTFRVRDNEDPLPVIKQAKEIKDISIIIIDERLIERIDHMERSIVDDSVDPVFITLSTEGTQEGLKNMIKKSIGIDLWKGE